MQTPTPSCSHPHIRAIICSVKDRTSKPGARDKSALSSGREMDGLTANGLQTTCLIPVTSRRLSSRNGLKSVSRPSHTAKIPSYEVFQMEQNETHITENLTRRQIAALPHLIKPGSLAAKAHHAGVARATLYHWLDDDNLCVRLQAARVVMAESNSAQCAQVAAYRFVDG